MGPGLNCATPGCDHVVYQHRSTYYDAAGVLKGWSCVMYGCRCEHYTGRIPYVPPARPFPVEWEDPFANDGPDDAS